MIYEIENDMQELALELEAVVETHKNLGMLPEKVKFWCVRREQWSASERNTTWRVSIGYGGICIGECADSPLTALYMALAELTKMHANRNDETRGET